MIQNHHKGTQSWYMRRGERIEGPFPAGLISRYLILGRIRTTDELSTDKESWKQVSEIDEVMPDVLQADLEDAYHRQRLMAAKRWEDEREMRDRRGNSELLLGKDRRRADRRDPETISEFEKRIDREDEATNTKTNERRTVGLVALLFLVALLAVFLLNKPKVDVDVVECDSPPRPGIDWSNCFMNGSAFPGADLTSAKMPNMKLAGSIFTGSQMVRADLSYTDLSVSNLRNVDFQNALMVGVNLQGSDLSDSNLSGADMTYADLSGANLDGVIFKNTRLGNAIWIDGNLCDRESVGRCEIVEQ